MNFHLQSTFIIICGFLWVKGDDCVYEVCDCQETEIRCPYRDLTSLPPLTGVLHGLLRLVLDNNAITDIPSQSLPPNLTSISMMNNPIRTITSDAFDGSALTLQELIFSNAAFTKIPDAIGRLKVLDTLSIYDTTIQDWNEEVMKNIGLTIQTLTIQNAGLTTWPSWIKHFSNLTALNIAGSSIASVPDDALDSLAGTLTRLSITTSNLKSIPKAFSNLINLEYLELENNEISNVTWLPQSNRLSSLYLTNNKIFDGQHLSDCLRNLQHSLDDFMIAQNRLTTIPDFSYMTKVSSLNLSKNRISNSIYGSLPSTLDSLELTYNNLPAIPVVFLSLPYIRDLVLSSNSITEIQSSQLPIWTIDAHFENNLITQLTGSSFPANSSLSSLNLMNNPLSTISNSAFKNLQQLTTLLLEGTRLTRMPLALTSLVNLNYLNVANSSVLVCTCLEKNLGSLILRLASNVLGQCGVTSVFDFYNTLSKDCP